MIRLVLAILFLVAPCTVVAQSVVVRSGEHDGFTRLVFNFPERLKYSLENTLGESRLSFEVNNLKFDTSSVFDRINQNRLSSLEVMDGGKTIAFELACECVANAFWYDDSMLVVDVSKMEPALNRPANSEIADTDIARGTLRPVSLQLPTRGRSAIPALTEGQVTVPALAPLTSDPSSVMDPETISGNAPNLSSSRSELVRQLVRAASQGLLTPSVTLDVEEESRADEQDSRMSQSHLTESPETLNVSSPDNNNIQLRAHSSIDLAFLERLSQGSSELSARSSCISSDQIDVNSWASEAPIWEQVSLQRGMLTSEFDRIKKTTVIDLARIYVYFGFGFEAKQVLALDPQTESSESILISLAEIMDNGYAGPNSALHNHMDCDGQIALWSVLAHSSINDDHRIDVDEVIKAFSSLPKHLRSHLGPVLSNRFLESGRSNASQNVLRILNRSPDTITPNSEMVLAEIESASGEDKLAEERFEKVAKSNAETAAAALVRMIDTQVARGNEVSYEIAQLAGAYAFEQADGVDGEALRRVHVLALAASGAFDEAFEILEGYDGTLLEKVRPELAEILTRDATDIDFLKHVLGSQIGHQVPLPDRIAVAKAKRLLSAGFPDIAASVIDASVEQPKSREARVLRAEIALARGLPRRAEVELLGLSGNDVNALRGRARSRAGDHAQAVELFRSAGMEDAAEREEWLAGSVDTKDPSVANAAPTAGVLAQNRSLLEASKETREALESLLSQKQVLPVEGH